MNNDCNVRAMILAAGAGSRLDPLTQLLPKPLVPIGNRPVMEHVLRLLQKHGINEVAANLFHLAEKVQPALESYDVHYVTEPVLSGDAGGLRACKSFFEAGTFVVLMGDIVTDINLTHLIKEHKRSGAIATIALQEVENVEQFGIVELNQDGFISGFKEKPKASETTSRLASIGIYVFEPEIFEHIPESGIYMFGKQLFPQLLQKDLPINGVRLEGYWSDIGTLASYKRTTFDALDGLIHSGSGTKFGSDLDLARGVQRSVSGIVLVGKNVTIGSNVEFIGHVVIGDNCTIESGACLIDSIVWSDSKVGAGSYVYDCILTTGTILAPDTVLEGQALMQSKTLTTVESLAVRRHSLAKVKAVAS
ncbi:MAG: NDP-sugar synthase [Candidatus Obscuribacterales bacterium]